MIREPFEALEMVKKLSVFQKCTIFADHVYWARAQRDAVTTCDASARAFTLLEYVQNSSLHGGG